MVNCCLPGVVYAALAILKIDEGTPCWNHSHIPELQLADVDYRECRGAIQNPSSLKGHTHLGKSKHCAQLLHSLLHLSYVQSKMGVSDGWRRGTPLNSATVARLEVGTPIGAGWEKNFYPGNSTGQHAGIFDGALYENNVIVGFWIVEQFSNSGGVERRTVYFVPRGKKHTAFYDGSAYAVIAFSATTYRCVSRQLLSTGDSPQSLQTHSSEPEPSPTPMLEATLTEASATVP